MLDIIIFPMISLPVNYLFGSSEAVTAWEHMV